MSAELPCLRTDLTDVAMKWISQVDVTRIIAAIVTEDPAAAEAAVRDHVAGVVETLRTLEARQERAS